MLIADKIKIKWLLHKDQNWELTDWELEFLKTIRNKKSITEKQRIKLDEIYQKIRHGDFFHRFCG